MKSYIFLCISILSLIVFVNVVEACVERPCLQIPPGGYCYQGVEVGKVTCQSLFGECACFIKDSVPSCVPCEIPNCLGAWVYKYGATNGCPTVPSSYNGAPVHLYWGYTCGILDGGSRKDLVWDASNDGAVHCTGKLKDEKDNCNRQAINPPKCESACGADSACDEKAPEDDCGSGSWERVSACECRRLIKTCNSDCSCVGNYQYKYIQTTGKVFDSNCNEVNPSSDSYCDRTINCVDNACSASRYYRGCVAGSTSCTDTNRQSYSAWNAPQNWVISETGYKIGTSCNTNKDYCDASKWNQCGGVGDPYKCQKGKDLYRCNGTGSCTYLAGTEWQDVTSGKVCINGNEEGGNCNHRCGYSDTGQCSANNCSTKKDCLACNGSNVCNVDVGDELTPCPANYLCLNGACPYSGSCGYRTCPNDTCIGSCPGCIWRDYPTNCVKYCDGAGNCADCTCTYTNRNPDDASGYCTGCGQTWDSISNKCCGDDGGATDTWCSSGNGSCVAGTWYSNHCSDGVKNCDETGVDCGGADCSPCYNLSVELSADPDSGVVPLNDVDLIDTVSGTMPGTVNFHFDCTNNGTWEAKYDGINLSVSDPDWVLRTDYYGNNFYTKITSPDAFAIKDLCDYSSSGNYTAKTFIERGTGNAQDTTPISVFPNSAPSAINLTVQQGNYCFMAYPPIILSWQFSDPNPEDYQTAYRVQIDDKFNFSSPEIDTGKVSSSSTSYAPIGLSYSTTYYWRVKVWDSGDAQSNWAVGPSFDTALHAYPETDFTFAPSYPTAGELIQFTDQTTYHNGATSWSWDFGDEGSSTLQNPTHSYLHNGRYTVSFTACDDIGCCTRQKEVIVSLPLPEWEEILPF